MREKAKQKMSNRFLRIIIIPIVIVLGDTMLATDFEAGYHANYLDSILGKGNLEIVNPTNSDSTDASYYHQQFDSIPQAKANSEFVSEEICNEGFVLLKNDGTLPLDTSASLTPLGYAFLNPVYSGSGSGGTDNSSNVTPEAALESDFSINQNAIEIMKNAKASSPQAAKDTSALSNGGTFGGTGDYLYEYNPSIYATLAGQVSSSTGLVFISRAGGEGTDKKRDAYDDGTPYYLALTQNEKDTISWAKENCKNVVVIVDSSNVMELSELEEGAYSVNAILWVGGPGYNGFQSMADILCGKVDPSGKTADIWPTKLSEDPTFQNFGEYTYNNVYQITNASSKMNFVEYEEGVYEGYRYYETASDLGAINYKKSVTYPFGYGLSYTSFTERIKSFSINGGVVSCTISMTNTGERSGKNTAEIYVTPPYTAFDVDERIEKPTAELVGFAKSSLLAPGGNEDITITFSTQDMASYDENHSNSDGTKGCYLLEEGDYGVTLRSDSHHIIATKQIAISKNVFFEGDNLRNSDKNAQSMMDDEGNVLSYPARSQNGEDISYTPVSNEFQECSDYMDAGKVTNLSRSNWSMTFPTAPTVLDSMASKSIIDGLKAFDYKTDPELGNVKGSLVYQENSPASNANNGIYLSNLRGKTYYDSDWDKLLDQLSFSKEGLAEIKRMVFLGAYQTSEISAIGKPATIDRDGPSGFAFFGHDASKWCSWCSEVVVASSWSQSLAEKMGEAIGQEGLANGINGWYGPGLNIHRSPFGGRNSEYYSEDGFLSGKIGAAVCSGAGDTGLVTFLKHFAMNDQETNRLTISTWASEQAIREIYLRPFEVCIKEARSHETYFSGDSSATTTRIYRPVTAVMSALNFIGTKGCFENYNLLTKVLRDEWGFTGLVETDMGIAEPTRQDEMIRAGGDIWMAIVTTSQATMANDCTSPTAQWCLRNVVHDVAYAETNSNAMQGFAPGSTFRYDLSAWKKWLIGVNVIIWIIESGLIVLMVLRNRDDKKHPEKYRQGAEKKSS